MRSGTAGQHDRIVRRSARRHRVREIAMPVTKAQVKRMALSFPGANENSHYGYPSFKIEKKFFTRVRSEDNSLVLTVGSMDEREMLLESDSALFHITPHYRNYPAVLARLEKLDAKTLRGMLQRRFRQIASQRLLK
jgi:hypothetical protein